MRTARAMIVCVAERLPSGVVTFVLSDIVGSTRLWESVPRAMETALARHEEILSGAMAAHGGVVLKARGEGDSTFSVFTLASDALAAAFAAQVALLAEPWPTGAGLAVRFAVHTGESVERGGDFVGPAVNRAARLRSVAQGGEVLVSGSTARLVADRLPAGVRLVELGEVRLRDLDRPEPSYVLAGPGLPETHAEPAHRGTDGRRELAERGVTRKEAEVLEALGEHLTNAEIASRLFVSERTVESHVSSLLRKFGVANRHELARAAQSRSGLAASHGPEPPAGSDRDRFPTAVTPLVDREVELAKISDLLAGHRLVTLVGAGGTGKTRLATHLASQRPESASGDSWYAEFAAVSGDGDIAEVLSAALGVRANTHVDPLERVARYLSVRGGLLILDNCEHVRADVAAICERIIQTAPSIRILTTSREPLGVVGEVLFPVPPLGTPCDNAPDTIATADAVRLFVERARSYNPDFSLHGDNAVAVAELCRSLDGLPLAIELAAARIPTMTPAEIVARLDHLFRVLGQRSDHVDHHRTLRATLDWSYDLLEADEQLLLSQLAIFAPGFSLAAVEALTQGTSGERDVLDVLSGLVGKSMVVAEAMSGTTRLRLLETVRAYGLEKAAEGAGQDQAKRRHIEFYTRLAEELVGPTVIADVNARAKQLAIDAGNIRLALDYAVDMDDDSSVFSLTAALVDLWCLWGWGAGILTALEAVLHRLDSDAPGRADACANAAWSAWSQGQHRQAISWCEESERRSTSDGVPTVPRVHIIEGVSRLIDRGDVARGITLCEQGLEKHRQSGQLRRYAHDLAMYGTYLAVVGEIGRSAKISAEAVELARQIDDRNTLSIGLTALGYTAIESDAEQARKHFNEVVEIGDPWCGASALWGIGWIDDRAGVTISAARYYRQALELWSETGDWRGMFYAVEGIAIVSARTGHPTSAVRLFAGADAIASDVGSGSMPQWNIWRDQHLDLLRDALNPADFSISWTAGERLERDVLVKEALVVARRTESGGEEAS
jgi:predicted ATPase/class 3 adenylate cyclase/DNA-binding CsgD family transcriptional regulator